MGFPLTSIAAHKQTYQCGFFLVDIKIFSEPTLRLALCVTDETAKLTISGSAQLFQYLLEMVLYQLGLSSFSRIVFCSFLALLILCPTVATLVIDINLIYLFLNSWSNLDFQYVSIQRERKTVRVWFSVELFLQGTIPVRAPLVLFYSPFRAQAPPG